MSDSLTNETNTDDNKEKYSQKDLALIIICM